jgi:hypothetical protein
MNRSRLAKAYFRDAMGKYEDNPYLQSLLLLLDNPWDLLRPMAFSKAYVLLGLVGAGWALAYHRRQSNMALADQEDNWEDDP